MDDYDRTTAEDRANKRDEDVSESVHRLDVGADRTYDTQGSEGFDTSKLGTTASEGYKESCTKPEGGNQPTLETAEDSGFGTTTSDDDKRYDSAETCFGVTSDDTAKDLQSGVTQSGYDSGTTAPHALRSETEGQDENRFAPEDEWNYTRSISGRGERYYTTPFQHASSENKEDSSGRDSTNGKMMEKAGDVLKNEEATEKGRDEREAAGYD